MNKDQKRQNIDNPSESQMNPADNLRDVEKDRLTSGGAPAEDLVQSDNSGKAFYQTSDEYEKDKSRNPQEGDKISISRMADRDTDTDKYRNSKLSDTEMGGE